MRYLLLIYDDETAWADADEAALAADMAEYGTVTAAFGDEGILRGGDALQPTRTATTVRVRDGEAMLTDGPFAETREQLGGFYVVECDTLDQAVGAARRIPAARSGSVEVRPILEMPG